MTDLLEAAPAAANRRLPKAYLGASYLAHGVATLGSLAGALVFLANPDIWPGRLAVAVFAAFFLLRVIDPLYEWATTRMTITTHDFRVTSGLLHRRTRSIRWSAVHSIETTAPWAYRLFGLVRVRIAQGGDGSTQVTLAGITTQFRDEILAHSPVPDSGSQDEASGSQSREAESPAGRREIDASPDPRGELVYRASVGDLVVASILFGRFAVVAIAIAFALFEQLDNFGLLGILDALNGVGVAGLSTIVAIAIVGLGVAGSVVRFSRLQVRITGLGGIAVSYGLIETNDRVIDSAGVTGVVLQRNALEMILGRVRLGLLTTDTSQQFGSNLLLPSLPRNTVKTILDAGFRDRVPAETLASRRGHPVRSIIAFSAVTSVAAGAGWWMHGLGMPLGLAAVGALALWAIIATSARPFVTTLRYDVDAQHVALRTSFIKERDVYLDSLSIHLVTSTAVRNRSRFATVHYYAGEPHQRGSVWFSEANLDALQAQLGERDRRAATLRSSRDAARQRRLSADSLGDVDDASFGGSHENLHAVPDVPLRHDPPQVRLDRRL